MNWCVRLDSFPLSGKQRLVRIKWGRVKRSECPGKVGPEDNGRASQAKKEARGKAAAEQAAARKVEQEKQQREEARLCAPALPSPV